MSQRHSSPLIALALALAAPALAPEGGDADARARVRAAAPPAGIAAVYDFDNDQVEGETLSPDGVPVPGSHRARFPSLIKVRGAFVDQVIRLANDV